MITEQQLRGVLKVYRRSAVRYNFATYSQLGDFVRTGHKCYGKTEDGFAFIVHVSPTNGEMAYSVGESLEELVGSLVMFGVQNDVPLELILDREERN